MLKNQMLQQAQAGIDKSVQDADVYERLVKAGGKVIYGQKTFHALTRHLRGSKDPVDEVARGMVSVLNLMAHRARGTIPQAALLQAGMTLLLDALDFLEQAGMLKVDAAVLDRATKEFVEALLPTVGLTRERMDSTLAEISKVMDDPQKMAAYRGSLGKEAPK